MEILPKILGASAELFRQYGFKTITMDDIARRAGISKKTLYQHFANKHEVVNESLVWYKAQMTEVCEALLRESENPVEAMVRMAAFMDETHKKINPMAMFELQRFFPETYHLFRELLIEKDAGMIRDNILEGIRLGLYRDNLNADLLARYRLETSLMIHQPNLMVNERDELLYVHMEIAEHFMYGIMTARGVELYIKYKQKYLKS
jgi:TetR/AcrR family transcriptional regulator, cholesterol catabolism regulator